MEFPEGRRFAFTILDDTDDSTLENVRPVYARLRELGFRTTKTVWPLDCPEGSPNYFAADTLARPEYLAFVRELVDAGFELGSHSATMESSDRARTIRGLAFLDHEFRHSPRVHANHGQNRENLYWGAERFRTPLLRGAIRRLGEGGSRFAGECEDSPFFWGDLCCERFDYVRNFTFESLDLLAVDSKMPYRLSGTPYVKHWFSTSDAPNADSFVRLLTPRAVRRLEERGGVSIVSTHLGKGFSTDGIVDPRVDSALTALAARPGWFVPVGELLDHLRAVRGAPELGPASLLALEMRFLLHRLRARLRG